MTGFAVTDLVPLPVLLPLLGAALALAFRRSPRLQRGVSIAVLYLVISGRAGRAPFVGEDPAAISDPLPQAMVLTAIVISLATIGFLLALSYRLWQISGTDDVPDDAEDARIQRLALDDQTSSTYDPSDASTTTSDELADGDGSP